MRYVLLLWHLDRSGIQQAFGPYDSEAEAGSARDDFKKWPALNAADHDDCWSIQPCMPTVTRAPSIGG